MNMITALLGATGLLLVVAVVLTVMKMNNANDEAELKELRAELAALSAQQSQLNPPAPAPPIDPGALAADPTSNTDEAEALWSAKGQNAPPMAAERKVHQQRWTQ